MIPHPPKTKKSKKSKPLHKDTDLGHFAGLAMVGYLSNSNPDVVRMDQEEIAEYCVNHAKELIKQLDSLHDTAPNHNE